MSNDATSREVPDSFTAGDKLTTTTGKKVNRFGSVKQACAILDGCDRQVIYDLLASGVVKGYKNNPAKPNSNYKVDLVTVWEHKQRQLQ